MGNFYHGVAKCSGRNILGSIEPIVLLWVSLERSFPPTELEYRRHQKRNKGQCSSRLVMAGTGVNGLSPIFSKIEQLKYFFVPFNLQLLERLSLRENKIKDLPAVIGNRFVCVSSFFH